MDARSHTHDVMDCRDPSTGELLGEVPRMREDEIVAAIHRARFLQPRWAALKPAKRYSVISAILERVVASQDELCRLAVHDSGETMLDAMVHEIIPVCRGLTALLDSPDKTARQRQGTRERATTFRRPSPGILGFIAPGYLPLRNLLLPLAPALLEGSAAVIKVSHRVAWSSTHFVELIRDVLAEHNHPRELVQLITGTVESGEALAAAGTDRLFFGGTPQTSRSVAAAASTSLTPVTLDIDVGRPIVVGRDCDPQLALQPALGRVFAAAGQLHGGAPLVYVHRSHYKGFVEAASAVVSKLRAGPPLASTVDCGPLIDASRLEPLERLLDDARSHGATLRVGGRRIEGLCGAFFEPTLVSDVSTAMQITEERLLGPVMAIHPFEDLRELRHGHGPLRAANVDAIRAFRAIPLYPARPSTYALLESTVRAMYGRGVRKRVRALLSATRHGFRELQSRALAPWQDPTTL